MNWLDIVIVIFIVFTALKGFQSGLISSVLGMVGTLVSILAGLFYYSNVKDYLNDSFELETRISSFLENRISINPDISLETIQIIDMPSNLNVVEGLSSFSVNIIAFFLVFAMVKIFFSITGIVLNSVIDHSGLTVFNRFLGFLFGALKGVLIIMVMITILLPFMSTNPAGIINSAIKQSLIGTYFFVYNPIPAFLSDFIY